MQSAQHRYAEQAYIGINEVKKSHSDLVNEYGQLCHRFPSLILTNGLRLAYIFFEKKSSSPGDPKAKAYRLYLDHMRAAVLGGDKWEEGLGLNPSLKSMQTSSSQLSYLHLSRNVLQASVWFKRYAEAILKVEQSSDTMSSEAHL